jgi:hypothetical protein
MILNDIRMSDTQLDPETDHTPYCPGRDKGFIIGRSKQLQIGSPARASARGTRGSQWKEKGYRAHAEGCDGYARAHARACAGGPQSRKLLLLQDLQKPVAAWSADP